MSPLGAPVIAVSIETEGVIRSASIAGQPLDLRDYAPAADGEIRFGYAAIPPEGIEVTLSVAADAPISVTLAETSYGLPTVPGLTVSPRLADTMPASGLPLDATIVRLSMTI